MGNLGALCPVDVVKTNSIGSGEVQQGMLGGFKQVIMKVVGGLPWFGPHRRRVLYSRLVQVWRR